VSKNFLHLPTLFDNDRSQRVWNLLNKAPDLIPLIEHPMVLPMVRHVMGQDCNLHDFQSTSIGPHTDGGAWHVDAPLGQIAEPLPDFPLTLQNVWMLDDFTAENGATRVMPRSHKLRKSPPWSSEPMDGEVILTAPAGSVAYDTRTRSLLDAGLSGLIDSREVTYSRPLAYVSFTKETVTAADGRAARVAPRLRSSQHSPALLTEP